MNEIYLKYIQRKKPIKLIILSHSQHNIFYYNICTQPVRFSTKLLNLYQKSVNIFFPIF